MNVPAQVRKTVLLWTPVLAVLVIVLSSVALRGELPADIPSRWGPGGAVVDTTGLWVLTALLALLAGGVGLLLQVVRRRIGEPVSQRVVGGLGVGVPVLLAALHVGLLLTARGAADPVAFPTAAVWGSLLLGALATGGAAAIVRPVERHGRALEATPLEIEPGEAVVWHGTGTAATWAWVLLGTTIVPVFVLLAVGLPWIAALVVVVVATGATVLRVRVTVGPQGVTARTGPFGVIRFHVPLSEVESVHAEVVDSLVYGGWGLRFLPGVRGLVVRNGPGLRVEREEGPSLVVTVDAAEEAAGVLLAHLEHQQEAGHTA